MVQVTRLAHGGRQARRLSIQAAFYNDRWGLERVDEFGREMFFRADGPDHHVLTLHSADAPGLHHFAFEVADVEDLDRTADDLAARGLPMLMPTQNNTVEYTAEVEQITAPDFAPKVHNPPIADQWKTVRPSGPGGR